MSLTEILPAFVGGILIGLAGILLLLTDGKVAGISGMIGGLFRGREEIMSWRGAFLLGLLAGGFLFHLTGYAVFVPLEGRSTTALVLAGILVGFGTRLGSGCTSGHAVCGMGRLSLRSLVATLSFMISGAVTVYVVHHLLEGRI
jgi:uncharacterized membrane protein YedE/YeeE